MFRTVLLWCFSGLFPEKCRKIALAGERQGRRNHRDRMIGIAEHIPGGLYFFILNIRADTTSHLFGKKVT